MFVSSSLSDVLFVQEAKVTAEMLPDVQNALQRNGWRGAFSAAVSKSRFGASGGVAVLARSHLGLCSMRYGENSAWNHEVEPGRVVEAFLPAAGGIVLDSVYLHDGEGLCERNRGILHLIGDRIRAHQLPVIVAGDFNFPVCVLQESGWMKRLQLHVLQPDLHVPTFVTRNGVSYNNFVLVSSSLLARCKGTCVKRDSGLHGHRPVCFNVALQEPMPKYRALVRGATIQFVKNHSCKAQPAGFAPVSKGVQVAAQHASGTTHEEAWTCAYEIWSRLAASELIPFLGIDGQKQVDVARRCSRRDVKTRWVAPVASGNAPVCDVEVSKRAWCIARDRLTDLLCVVQKRVLPSYASQVGRALMRALRRWPDDFGVHWYAALEIWAGIARWPLRSCLDCRATWLLHTLNWRPLLVICLSKPHLREFEDGGNGHSRLCQTRRSLRFNGLRAEISFHSLCR